MIRRGYSSEGILGFIDYLGVSRTTNDAIIPMHNLEDKIRDNLDVTAKRTLSVLEPVLVNITNMKDGEVKKIEALDFPF
jgi:glutaminyl-tRNA synthetase